LDRNGAASEYFRSGKQSPDEGEVRKFSRKRELCQQVNKWQSKSLDELGLCIMLESLPRWCGTLGLQVHFVSKSHWLLARKKI